MRLISHRGNLQGKAKGEENMPKKILQVLKHGIDCEIDLWFQEEKLFLGHDSPEYFIDSEFLIHGAKNLWIHCKNIEALIWCQDFNSGELNFFWHETDKVTLTSLGFIWAYPGFQPIKNSIAVMPEISDEKNLSHCLGICSDFILKYKELYESI